MGDANRFFAPWVERYGQNLREGDVLRRGEILAVLRDWNYCDVHRVDNTDRDAVIACPDCQRREMDLGQFTSSIKMPLAAGLVTTSLPDDVGIRGNTDFECVITDGGVRFIQMVDWEQRGVELDRLEEFQKRQGHGDAIQEWFFLEVDQLRLLLEIILNEDPGDGGKFKSQIICIMRYIHMTRGSWIPKYNDICPEHQRLQNLVDGVDRIDTDYHGEEWLANREELQGRAVIDDVIGCPDCFDGHLTKENCEIFHSVCYPDKARPNWNARTLRNNLTEGASLCEMLGLIIKDDAGDYETVALTETGSRVYQLLELREYLSLNERDMPTRILNPYLGAMQYADEVGIVTRM